MSIADIVSHDLKLPALWQVTDCTTDQATESLIVNLVSDPAVELQCPICGGRASTTGGTPRTWRHLNFMEYRTVIQAVVPKVECEIHGTNEVSVPWAQAGVLGTYKFEAQIVEMMTPDNIDGIARLYKLSPDEAQDIWKRHSTD